MSARGGRFNLLLLEVGEYYLEDVIVTYAPLPPGKGVKFPRVWAKRQKGRLKLCTHSVFFVPNDVAQPISKFCFRRIEARLFAPWLAYCRVLRCALARG
jgi:factor associated with neutral sphingomyelinase activation